MSPDRRWTRHFVYRSERLRTTWKFRIGLALLFVAAVWLTSPWWTVGVANSLVCDANVEPADAILIENFDPNYLLFEHTTTLRRDGFAQRVIVPIFKGQGPLGVSAVSEGVAEVMAKIAHLGEFDIVPIREVEPISLNAARDILGFLDREGIRSVIVVTPLFRSRRSALVYSATLGRAGVEVMCQPVQGTRGVADWFSTWHGIQNVAEQWLKLQYYRMYVLPFGSAN